MISLPPPEPTCPAATAAARPVRPAQPFYIVAHRTNTLAEVAAALAAGAHGVEVDVNVARSTPDELRIGHGSAFHSGHASPRAPRLTDFLRGLRELARTHPLGLVYFDCKPLVARRHLGPHLLDMVRRELTEHPDTPAGLRVVFSFPKTALVQMQGPAFAQLRAMEILMVDQELDYGRVRDHFGKEPTRRYGYGNGSSVAQPWFAKLLPISRASLEQACRDRDAGTGPALVGICTVNDEHGFRTYLELGVNLIMTDLHPPLHCPGPGLRTLVRMAGQNQATRQKPMPSEVEWLASKPLP